MNNRAGRCILAILLISGSALAQDVQHDHADSWQLSGLIQFQYFYNADIPGDAPVTNNGFRIRRARLKAAAELTDWVETKFQVEIRDNRPRLKDAEGSIRLFENVHVRMGQFKVPVWREEMKSAGNLLLIERSAVADVLLNLHVSSRQIGVEVDGRLGQLNLAFNVSNGAGEGVAESAGSPKGSTVNNARLYTARVSAPLTDIFDMGISVAVNELGSNGDALADPRRSIYVLAQDFAMRLATDDRSHLDLEGGVVFGSEEITGADDRLFTLFDLTGRWHRPLDRAYSYLAGLDAYELAAGVTFLEPDTEISDNVTWILRGGPGLYFGQKVRLQLNGEWEILVGGNREDVFQVRFQSTFKF